MDLLGRHAAPFSSRVWQQIDSTVAGIKASNCTARRFLTLDGPYGLGLSVLSGDEEWLKPAEAGASPDTWQVPRAQFNNGEEGKFADPDEIVRRGTFLVQPPARPVAMIASEFLLGIRAIEGFDDDCQPLELARATRAARDVALEEERLLYYGGRYQEGLLVVPDDQQTTIDNLDDTLAVLRAIHAAIRALAERGFPGPFALAVGPGLYTRLYDFAPDRDSTLVEVLRDLFASGVHMVPVITPQPGDRRLGVVVTCAAPYLRLVIGQDWITAFRGTTGVFLRFAIMESLRLDISEPRSREVLLAPAAA